MIEYWDADTLQMPADVRFHFIGHLQTNKVKELVSVPTLHCVHTVDSLKLVKIQMIGVIAEAVIVDHLNFLRGITHFHRRAAINHQRTK